MCDLNQSDLRQEIDEYLSDTSFRDIFDFIPHTEQGNGEEPKTYIDVYPTKPARSDTILEL